MRLVFFGTPTFADVSLKALCRSRHSVVCVVTQPDRPKGRSRDPVPSPVKETALATNLPVLQPLDLKEGTFLKRLRSFQAELAVVVAYGRILPLELLEIFPRGAINLHASLLPKYRGAAPIQWALIQGETETGVTVFQLDDQLDHGPILLQATHPIRPEENAVTLNESLSRLGAETLLKGIDLLENGLGRPEPQNESFASAAPRLTKEEGRIDWKTDCRTIHHRIRGLQSWPGAATHLSGESVKLLAAHPDPARHDPALKPGTVALADPAAGLWVQTGKGQLRIDRLQLPGGTPLDAASFLRGHRVSPGTILV